MVGGSGMVVVKEYYEINSISVVKQDQQTVPGGAGGEGGDGGRGRGFNFLSGSLAGSTWWSGGSPFTVVVLDLYWYNHTVGGTGFPGETGGDGGEWGARWC